MAAHMAEDGQTSSGQSVKAVCRGVSIRLDGILPIPLVVEPPFICVIFFLHLFSNTLRRFRQKRAFFFVSPGVGPSRLSVEMFALTTSVWRRKCHIQISLLRSASLWRYMVAPQRLLCVARDVALSWLVIWKLPWQPSRNCLGSAVAVLWGRHGPVIKAYSAASSMPRKRRIVAPLVYFFLFGTKESLSGARCGIRRPCGGSRGRRGRVRFRCRR